MLQPIIASCRWRVNSRECKFSIHRLSEDHLLKDNNPENDEILNNQSASYQQFKLQPEESKTVDEFNAAADKIREQQNELQLKLREIDEKKNKFILCEDIELKNLLEKYIKSKNGLEHKISCEINKLKKIVEVVIIKPESDESLVYIFQSLLKAKPKIENRGSRNDLNDPLMAIISFKLRDRDHLITALKNDQQLSPRTKRLMQLV